MTKRNQCGICKKKEAEFYCILCESFFCGNCNTIFHDEACPTKKRSLNFNENIRNTDSVAKWLEKADLYISLENSCLSPFDKDTIDNNHIEIVTKEKTYLHENMSERAVGQKKQHSSPSRRAPVPCPRLPSSFKINNKESNPNYSYASIEFRPAIITDDGVTAAPANDDDFVRETELLNDDLNNEDYHWEDELPPHGSATTDADSYAEIEIGTGFDVSHNRSDGSAPKLPQRYTSDKRTDDSREPRREIYEDPVDTRPNEKDLSELYAVVDFSKKKNRSRKGVIHLNDTAHAGEQPHQQIVEHITNSVNKNIENEVPKSQIKTDVSKVGKSKFFVDIPETRDGAPPPVPKPYAARRKKSAPALLFQELPPLPPRTKEALSDENYRSNEELNASYAIVGDIPNTKSAKGHRRNLSGDLHLKSRDLNADLTNGVTDRPEVSSPAKRSFKKQHRRMKSHETISTVFSPTHKDEKADDKENDISRSGPSSAESSLEDSASVSKESQDSVGSSYDDMSELMRKAEALISDELPEGWQEVRDGNEVYYWHIWTGTIQYERPVLSATPSSSSRSLSPSFSDTNSSQSPSVSEIQEKGIQSKSPEARPDSPHDKPKQAISFPVHSMGWTEVQEELMSSNVLADTVNHCISSLAEQRKDLWKIAETWGEGKDIKLILEGESLKLVEPKSKAILLVQPIAKMRVWGVGKEDQRDFAYIARDPKTNRHKCHMFRCHGNVSGRSIANTLHAICNRVLEEKRRAKEKNTKAQKVASDLLNAPVSSSARGNTAFNEKPYFEQKKCFSAKYIGWTEVTKSSGIDTLNKAVNKLFAVREPSEWKTVLVEITISEIKTIDCSTQEVLMEDRVRFISFLGVAKDERMCGYIVAVGMETFVCHVFCCIPHAGTLTRAIEEACKLRYEKFLHKNAEENSNAAEVESNVPQFQQRPSVKEKSGVLKSSVQGLFQKLQKKDSRKKGEGSQSDQDNKIPVLQPGANEYLIKYFGCVQVELGTGVETVQESVEQLSGGAMMIGFLEVTRDGLNLCDSQRTALSRRVIDLDTVSYCGITSNKEYFGIIVSQGRGKYACHVCQEYKTPVGNIVSAIHAML